MAKKLKKTDKFYGLTKAFKRGDLRDTGRALVVSLKNDLGIEFDSKKLSSWEDVYSWILSTIKTYKCKDNVKALLKEIQNLKDEIALISNDNRYLSEALKNRNEQISNYDKEYSELLKENVKVNKILDVDRKIRREDFNAFKKLANSLDEHKKKIEKLKFKNRCMLFSSFLFLGLSVILFFKR